MQTKFLAIVVAVVFLIPGVACAQTYGTCGNPGPIRVKVVDPEWSFVPCAESPVVPDYFTFRVSAGEEETSFRLPATQVVGTQEVTVPFAQAWPLRPGENRVQFRPHSHDVLVQGTTEEIVFLYVPPVVKFPEFSINLKSGGSD
jgi:hypothetical protein